MKITIFVTEGAMQFNLTPESEHERRMVSTLREHKGSATVNAGVDIGMCVGGYVRSFGDDSKSVAITIDKPPAEGPR